MTETPLPLTTQEAGTKPEETTARRRYPLWWRAGQWPMVVLLMAAAAGDLFWPNACLGLGAAVAALLLVGAMLMLRRDLSRAEQVFLAVLGLVCFALLAVGSNVLGLLAVLLIPALMLFFPSPLGDEMEDAGRYESWMSFWCARRPKMTGHGQYLRHVLPMRVTGLIGLVLFLIFVLIVASENPVVSLIWEWIAELWNRFVLLFHLDWGFLQHVVLWLLGVVAFGIYARRRAPEVRPTVQEQPAAAAGQGVLPHLPMVALIPVNLASLLSTRPDVIYRLMGFP